MSDVTFRLARESDKRYYAWKRMGVNQTRPDVVSMNGHVVLIVHERHVLYQRSDLLGSDTIADLLRARDRVHKALQGMLYDGDLAVRRRGSASQLSPDYVDPMEAYRDFVRDFVEPE